MDILNFKVTVSFRYGEVFLCVARNSVPKCHPSVLKRHILGQKTQSTILGSDALSLLHAAGTANV